MSSEPDLGSWGRYPSHTREKRTGSAGVTDRVDARDFADRVRDGGEDGDDDSGDGPRTLGKRSLGLTSSSGGSSSGKRTGRRRRVPIVSRGIEIVREVGHLLGSPSMDYMRHGFARRASVSIGGEAQDPDLEMVEEVWAPRPLKLVQNEYGEGSVVGQRRGAIVQFGDDGTVEEPASGRTSRRGVVVACIRSSLQSDHDGDDKELSPGGSSPEARNSSVRHLAARSPIAESIRCESWSSCPEIQIGGDDDDVPTSPPAIILSPGPPGNAAVAVANVGTEAAAAGPAETAEPLPAAPTTATPPRPTQQRRQRSVAFAVDAQARANAGQRRRPRPPPSAPPGASARGRRSPPVRARRRRGRRPARRRPAAASRRERGRGRMRGTRPS